MPSKTNAKAKLPVKIEKRRQSHAAAEISSQSETRSFDKGVGSPRGVLPPADPSGGKFLHFRLAPPPHLATWVQHYWMVQWDLRESGSRMQETLPHPSVQLLFEQNLHNPARTPNEAEIAGVCTGKFSRQLEGWGGVFGVKFKPGGFRPFLEESVSTLRNRVVPADQIFGPSILKLRAEIDGLSGAEEMAKAASEFLTTRLPKPDPSVSLSSELVDRILNDPSLLTVDQLAALAGMGLRSLQRLFEEYVGVSPKWVIRRYRLHELMERFHTGQPFDGAQLALDLGYADQAHLINDFRNLVGYTPSEYHKLVVTAQPQ
jgi:AraC-like DNA-binding protein